VEKFPLQDGARHFSFFALAKNQLERPLVRTMDI